MPLTDAECGALADKLLARWMSGQKPDKANAATHRLLDDLALTPLVAEARIDSLIREQQVKVAVGSRFSAAISDRGGDYLLDLCRGLSLAESAEAQSVSVETVKTWRKKLYNLLGVDSAPKAIAVAFTLGLVERQAA